MNICNSCGTQFEGSYCPECGTKHTRQRICLNCGEPLTGRFCVRCGTAFDYTDAESFVTLSSLKEEEKAPERVCRVCGSIVTGKFYSECGAQFDLTLKVCRNCGRIVTGKYCPECGKRYRGGKVEDVETPEDSVETLVESSREEIFSLNPLPESPALEDDGKTKKGLYLVISRIVLALFLVYAVLFIVACAAMTETYVGADAIVSVFSGEGKYDTWMSVFCILNAAIAACLAVWAFVQGGRKAGKLSLYQIVGIVGIVFMVVGLIGGVHVFGYAGGRLYDGTGRPFIGTSEPGAGPVCMIVFSAVFMALIIIFLIVSGVLTKKNTGYVCALISDRNRLKVYKEQEKKLFRATRESCRLHFISGMSNKMATRSVADFHFI